MGILSIIGFHILKLTKFSQQGFQILCKENNLTERVQLVTWYY